MVELVQLDLDLFRAHSITVVSIIPLLCDSNTVSSCEVVYELNDIFCVLIGASMAQSICCRNKVLCLHTNTRNCCVIPSRSSVTINQRTFRVCFIVLCLIRLENIFRIRVLLKVTINKCKFDIGCICGRIQVDNRFDDILCIIRTDIVNRTIKLTNTIIVFSHL